MTDASGFGGYDMEGAAERVSGAVRESRTYARGDLAEVDHRDVYPFAGLIEDPEIRDYLAFCAEVYDPADDMPSSFWETDYAQKILRKWASHTLTRAIQEGSIEQIEFVTGWPQYDSDVSGLHAIQKLEDWLLYSERCKCIYLAAHMGNGKTDLAHLFMEVVEHRSAHDSDLADAEIRCNIPSSDYETITDYETFKEWVESGEHGENRWFIFDEASSVLSGYSHDRAAVEQLISHLVKLARKYGVNFLIIGHTGKDLHADLRRLCDYVTKPSLKTARFYATVNDSAEGVGHLFDLDALPATRVEFRTDDEAPWSWGDALDDDERDIFETDEFKNWRNQRIRDLNDHSGIDQSGLSAAFDLSVRQVRRVVNGTA